MKNTCIRRMHAENILFFAMFAVACLVLSSCHKRESSGEREKAERTVIVYMVADNTLYGYADYDLDEMSDGMKGVDGNLVVYLYDGIDAPSLIEIDKNGARRTVKRYAEHNPLKINTMQTVVRDIMQSYPADSFIIDLWSHANAWYPAAVPSEAVSYSFGESDNYNSSSMNIADLATALEGCGHFEAVIFDACLMSNIESLYQLRKTADNFIAAPTETSADGLPYDKVLPILFEKEPDYKNMLDVVYASYNGKNITMSHIESARLEELAEACGELLASDPQAFAATFSLDPVYFLTETQCYIYSGSLLLSDLESGYKMVFGDTPQMRAVSEIIGKCVTYSVHSSSAFGYRIYPDKYSGLSTSFYCAYMSRSARDSYRATDWYKDVIEPYVSFGD